LILKKYYYDDQLKKMR